MLRNLLWIKTLQHRNQVIQYCVIHIASLVNEGFYTYGGRIRCVPVTIGGTTYTPPTPIESIVKDKIEAILNKKAEPVDIAIELCLYCMKAQIFNDGNKRASVIFANHFLISNGAGLLVIPEKKVSEFKKMLVSYYEDRDNGRIFEFMKKNCWKNLNQLQTFNNERRSYL